MARHSRAVLAFTVVLSLAPPAAAQTTTGVIAYSRGDTVYVARPDGTGERAWARGFAPALTAGDSLIAWSVASGGANQLMVGRLDDPGSARQVTSLPDEEATYGPGRYGVFGAVWSPSRTRLALRLQEGSTTTLATVDADGTGFRRYDFGHLFGSRILWRDDDTIVVGTDEGPRMVTYGGDARPVPGAERGDTPVGWETDGILYVNDAAGGMSVVFVDGGGRAGLHRPAVGWGVLPARGLVFTTDSAVEVRVRTDSEHYADLPPGAQVLDLVTDREPMLAELAGVSGEAGIYTVPGGGPFTRVATGSGVTLSTAASYDAVSFGSSAVAGARGVRGSAPGPVDPPPGRSAFSEALPAAGDVSTDLSTVLVNLLLTALLMLLIAFPAELFNSTLEEHYDEVRGWFGLRGRSREPRERSRAQRVGLFAAYTLAAAALYGLLDPSFGVDGTSLRQYAGLAIGLVVVTVAFGLAPLLYARRRYRERGLLRVLPGTLAVGAFCVLVSRLADFQPGYLYGVVGGFAFSRAFSKDEEGRNALVAATGVLAVSVVAWLAWQPVDDAAASGHPGLLLGLTDSTLSAIAVGGLEGLVIGLLPLRSLPGYALSRWRRPVWAVAFGAVLFAFVHLLLHPARGFGDDVRPVPFFTWLALFVGFGAVSVAFWAYFRFRAEPRQ